MREVFEFAKSRDPAALSSLPNHEHPQYEDKKALVGNDTYLSPCSNPSIAVTSPSGGDVWYMGTPRNITWLTTNFGTGENVKIELWNRSGTSYRKVVDVATVSAAAKIYKWTIPNTSLVSSSTGDFWINISRVTSPVVMDKSNSQFTISPYGKVGYIKVNTTPYPNTTVSQAGATVYIDSLLQPSKVSNTTIYPVYPGTHWVSVTRTGFMDPPAFWGNVAPGQTLPVNFVMTPLEGNGGPETPAYEGNVAKIDITSSPVDGEILVGGESSGLMTNEGPIGFDPGYYEISVMAEGYQTSDVLSFTVEPGETKTLAFTLIPGYVFTGFEPPVVMNAVNDINTRKISSLPLKWHLSDPQGNSIENPASFVSVLSYNVTCDKLDGNPALAVPESSAGDMGLQYLGGGNWQYNMKINKTYAGTCRNLSVLFDTTLRSPEVAFKFR
jgi:hypothetical protein